MRRINPDPRISIEDMGLSTRDLMKEILIGVIKEPDHRAHFYAAAGTGAVIVQRVRMEISRQRAAMRNEGKPVAAFRIPTRIYPETHHGVRYDSVVLQKQMSRKQLAIDLMAQFDEIYNEVISHESQ